MKCSIWEWVNECIKKNVGWIGGDLWESTLCMHIARNKTHIDVYCKQCKAAGVEPHPHAIFCVYADANVDG